MYWVNKNMLYNMNSNNAQRKKRALLDCVLVKKITYVWNLSETHLGKFISYHDFII